VAVAERVGTKVWKTIKKEIGGINFELRIMEGGISGGFAHVSPRIPTNNLALEVIRWAKEEIGKAGKEVEQVFYYVHKEVRSETYALIPYGELSIMYLHRE
jgi:hypothetical protein